MIRYIKKVIRDISAPEDKEVLWIDLSNQNFPVPKIYNIDGWTPLIADKLVYMKAEFIDNKRINGLTGAIEDSTSSKIATIDIEDNNNIWFLGLVEKDPTSIDGYAFYDELNNVINSDIFTIDTSIIAARTKEIDIQVPSGARFFRTTIKYPITEDSFYCITGTLYSGSSYTLEDREKLDSLPTAQELEESFNSKVDKVNGKALSDNNFTDSFKEKLENIESGAEVNVNADWNAQSGDAKILNKPTTIAGYGIIDALIRNGVIQLGNNDITPVTDIVYSGNKIKKTVGNITSDVVSIDSIKTDLNLTKSDVGLSNVDNTSDANKPISNAVQSALSNKVDKVEGKGLSDNNYTTSEQVKLHDIESNAQVNIIESVKVNNEVLPITDKSVNVTVPSVSPYFDTVDYVSADNMIYFKHGQTVLGTVDTTDFVKDSFLESADIETPSSGPNAGKPCLVLTFNSDGSSQRIEIPLEDIFNPDNYYDKTASDARFQLIINDLSTIRDGAAAGSTAYQLPSDGIPSSDLSSELQTSVGLANSSYQKPNSGIPKSDLSSNVQTSLGLADTALQSFTETDPTVPSWAKAQNKPSYSYSEIADTPTIPSALSDLSDDSTHRLVTDNEKTTWGAKYDKPSGGIPSTDMTSAVQTSLGKADSAYQKPGTGIPKTDLADAVQTSLGKADTAIQDISGKADKVSNATAGHLAKLDATGNLVDGGDTADYAKNLVAPVVQSDAEFVYRKTGGSLAVDGAGGAVLQKIKGKTLVWNQHSHMNPSDSFTSNNCTVTYGTDRVTIVVGSGGATSGINVPIGDAVDGKEFIVGHKYLMSVDPDFEMSNSTIKVGCSYYFWNTRKRQIYNCTQGPQGTFALRVEPQGGTWETATGTYVVRYPMLIDLTLMFGAGNEPSTVEEFEAMYPGPYYDYNPGTLISNDASAIETVGFNQWDEEWLPGTRSSSDGETYGPNGGFICSKNKIPVVGGQTYYMKCRVGVSYRYFFYDANGAFINTDTASCNDTLAIPDGVCFINFQLAYPDTYNHDICINLSDTAKNGIYEPYKKTVTQLNLGSFQVRDNQGNVTTITGGLKSAGSVYDEIVGNKYVKRVGSVDLGTLTYTSGVNHVFRSPISDIKKSATTTSVAKLITPPYQADTPINVNLINKTIASDESENKIAIRDESYSDAAIFKAAMSGVMLYYELATPVEYTLETVPDYTYPVDGDGTERRLPEDTASSVHAPFRADILYALNGASTLRNLDANYVRNDNIKQDTGNNENTVMSQAAVTREMTSLSNRINDAIKNVVDLSYIDPITGLALASRNTANTYVICEGQFGAGTMFKFPVVYGNGIKNGVENPAAYTNLGGPYCADFVNHLGNTITSPWIERNAGCTPYATAIPWRTDSNEAAAFLVDGWDGKYIQFELSSTPSSDAIYCITLADPNNDIIWSWNIWYLRTAFRLKYDTIVNHTGVEYRIMNRPLCSIKSGVTQYQCALYQWGRKDIIGLPSAYNSSTPATLYGSVTSLDTYGVTDDADAGGTVRSVANAIKMPDKFFLEYDNTKYNWNNLPWFNNFWNAAITSSDDLADNQATAIKTIYDPSPVGFMIPAGRFATGFTTPGTNSSTASELNVVGSFSYGWNFKKNSADAAGAYWPASGYRNRTSGGLDYVGSYGFFWSFAPYSQTYARRLGFGSGDIRPLDYGERVNGYSVRPSVELT